MRFLHENACRFEYERRFWNDYSTFIDDDDIIFFCFPRAINIQLFCILEELKQFLSFRENIFGDR